MKQFDIPEIIDDSFIIQFFSLQNTDKINPSRTKESFIKRFINIDNISRQYKTKEYPFCCDFYIKPLNLYIEIQGYWTHGSHPYDSNNINDLQKLDTWKQKSINTMQYETAINIWTVKDVLKRQTAKQNNLNYLEIFSIDLQKAIDIFETYIMNHKNKKL